MTIIHTCRTHRPWECPLCKAGIPSVNQAPAKPRPNWAAHNACRERLFGTDEQRKAKEKP